MASKTFRLWRDQQGGVLITTGLSILFLVGVAGAAVDLGRQQLLRARTQQASDAAALAAGGLVNNGVNVNGQQVALRYFNLNFSPAYMGMQRPTPSVQVGTGTIAVQASHSMRTAFTNNIGVGNMNATGRTVVAIEGSKSAAQKYDVILVMDASGSMETTDVGNSAILPGDTGAPCGSYVPSSYNAVYGPPCPNALPSRMNALRYAANTLTTALLNPNDTGSRVAAVTWSDSALNTQSLSGSYSTVRTFLGKMFSYQGTNSTAGLAAAEQIAGSFSSDSVHALVLLTDGQNGSWANGVIGGSVIPASVINPQSLTICSRFKSQQTVVYTIALGTPVINDSVARNFLRDCASDNPTGGKFFYTAPNGQTLNQVFETIVTEIKKLRISE